MTEDSIISESSRRRASIDEARTRSPKKCQIREPKNIRSDHLGRIYFIREGYLFHLFFLSSQQIIFISNRNLWSHTRIIGYHGYKHSLRNLQQAFQFIMQQKKKCWLCFFFLAKKKTLTHTHRHPTYEKKVQALLN